ncbi:hypothetical protein T05_1877 [Trichinella murrelli]|uniref:Uncharacterized protein n=1 Tax=Trichinella murrelli TaxID=144512 RepID=A0A0V0TWS2_9BILA|nr:hypothetical protein T05_1877 [Trichinella murrelli]
MAKKRFNGNCDVVLEKRPRKSSLWDSTKLHCLAHSFTCLGNPFFRHFPAVSINSLEGSFSLIPNMSFFEFYFAFQL